MTTPTQETYPLMPLDTLRRFLQYHPYHWWGMTNPSIPVNSQCNNVVSEYGYQAANKVGRAELRDRILYAEQKLADYLRYDVAPRYRVETQPWPSRFDHIPRRYPRDANGEYIGIQLNYGHIQSVGVETVTTIAASAAVTTTLNYTAADTFTLSVATSVTNADEIAVYFTAADRAAASGVTGEPLSPRWRIAPVTVSISGGVATITGPTWLLVKPSQYQSLSSWNSVNPADPGVLATAVDVARVYIDPDGQTLATAQANLLWETWPWSAFCWVTPTSPNNPNVLDPAAVGKAVARVGIRNATMGVVIPGSAVYNATSSPPQWISTAYPNWTDPDRVEVRYLAGVPLVNGQMDQRWADIVCMLTLAELPGPICACKETNLRIERWQQDLARSSGNGGEQYAYISSEDLNGPFGTRRGHIEAWRRVQQLRNMPAVLV